MFRFPVVLNFPEKYDPSVVQDARDSLLLSSQCLCTLAPCSALPPSPPFPCSSLVGTKVVCSLVFPIVWFLCLHARGDYTGHVGNLGVYLWGFLFVLSFTYFIFDTDRR